MLEEGHLEMTSSFHMSVCTCGFAHTWAHTHRFTIQVIVLARLAGSSPEVGSGPAGLYNINTTSKHPGSDSFLFARTGFYSVIPWE